MGVGCPAAIVALFLVELNSTLYQGLPADLSTIPVENHELVVSKTYSKGSIIDSNFSNVRILYLQEDPTFNPYFGLDNQSSMLYNKVSINLTQSNIGTFLMAVNKQNQTEVESLYCVTYCIGALSEPKVHETCFETINSGALYDTLNESLLSQNNYEKNISPHIPPAYAILQLALTPWSKSNVSFSIINCNTRLFFLDEYGMLRSGRNVTEDQMGVHVLKIVVSASISDLHWLDQALVTVKVSATNDYRPMFEQPNGYTFSVNEGKQGLSVGFVKAVDFDGGFNGKVAYSFGKRQDTSFFQLNRTTGEIQTAMPLDRETADSHMFTVIAIDHGIPNSLSSQVDVRVFVKDVNDNPPVFVQKEYSLLRSLDKQPGLLLRVNATDADVGQNAEIVYTITDGNDKELFWINSTSGELFLAPFNVTADDSTVLVVKAQNKVPTNPSLQDSALVRLTFYAGNETTVSRKIDVAVETGFRLGFVLVVAVTVVTVVGLCIWQRKRKRAQEQRQKYESYFIEQSGQMPFDYVSDPVAVTDRRSDSRFSLKHTEVDLWSPFTPHSPVQSSSSLSSEREHTKEAEIRLDLSDMESESLSDVQLPKQSSESLESGGSASPPVIVSVFSDFKACPEHLDLSGTEFDTQSRSQLMQEVSVGSSDEELRQSSKQVIKHKSEPRMLSSDELGRKVNSLPCVAVSEIREDSPEKTRSEKITVSEDRSAKELLTATKTARPSLPTIAIDHSGTVHPSSSSDDSLVPSSKEKLPLLSYIASSFSSLLSLVPQILTGQLSDMESSVSGDQTINQESEKSSSDHLVCEVQSPPSVAASSSSEDSFASCSSGDVLLSSHKTSLADSLSSLLSKPPKCFARDSSDKELRQSSDQVIKDKSKPGMLSSDLPMRKVVSLPCVATDEIMEDSAEKKRSEKTKDSEDPSNKEALTATKTSRVSLPVPMTDHSNAAPPSCSQDELCTSSSKEEVLLNSQMTILAGSSLSLLSRPYQFSKSELPDKESRQSSDQVIKHISKPRIPSSDELIREVKLSPCVVAGEIMEDSAEKTRYEKTTDIEDQSNKEFQTATKTARFSLPVSTTDHSERAFSSSSQDESTASSFSKDAPLSSDNTTVSDFSFSLLSSPFQILKSKSKHKETRQLSDQAIKHKSKPRVSRSDELGREMMSPPFAVAGKIVKDSSKKAQSEKTKDTEDQSKKELLTATKDASFFLRAPTTDRSEATLPTSSQDELVTASSIEEVPLSSYNTALTSTSLSLLSSPFQFLKRKSKHILRSDTPDKESRQSSDQAVKPISEASILSSGKLGREVKSVHYVAAGEIMADSAEKTRSKKTRESEDQSNRQLLTATRTVRLPLPVPTSDHSMTAFSSSSSGDSLVSRLNEIITTSLAGSLSSSESSDSESSDQAIKHESTAIILGSDQLVRDVKSPPGLVACEIMDDSAEKTRSKKTRESEDQNSRQLLTATKTVRLPLPVPTSDHSMTTLSSSSSSDSLVSCLNEIFPTALASSLPSSEISGIILRQSSDQAIKHESAGMIFSPDQLVGEVKSPPCLVTGETMDDSADKAQSEKLKDSEDQPNKQLLTAKTTARLALFVPETDYSTTALSRSSSDGSFVSRLNEDVPAVLAGFVSSSDSSDIESSNQSIKYESVASIISSEHEEITEDSVEKMKDSEDQSNLELFTAKTTAKLSLPTITHHSETVLPSSSSDHLVASSSKETAPLHSYQTFFAGSFSSMLSMLPPFLRSQSDRVREVPSPPCDVADEIMEDSAEKTRLKKMRDSEDKSNTALLTPTKTDSFSVPVPTTDHSETALLSSSSDESYVSCSSKGISLNSHNTAFSGSWSSLLSRPPKWFTDDSSDKKLRRSSDQVIKYKSKPGMLSSDELIRKVISAPCAVVDKRMADSAEITILKEVMDSENESNNAFLTATETDQLSVPDPATQHLETALPSSFLVDSFASCSSEEGPLSSRKKSLAGSFSSQLSKSLECVPSDSSDKELRQSSHQVIKHKSKLGMLSSDQLIRKAMSLPCVVADETIEGSAEKTRSKKTKDSEDPSNKELLIAKKD